MKITLLAENTSVSSEIGAEHGLSMYLETCGKKILFDMGQTALFAENAEKLGIDLAKVDFAVLSHGHYDHGGGLETFLEINSTAPVFLSPYAFEEHFNAEGKNIGLSPELQGDPRFSFVEKKWEIFPNITLYPNLSRPLLYPKGCGDMTTLREGEEILEDFRHEIYLEICEGEKRILFSGCSHRGILNIATEFSPRVLIGGFHFSKLPLDDTLRGYAEILSSLPTTFYTCHCTGKEQYDFMKETMPRLFTLSTGETLEI